MHGRAILVRFAYNDCSFLSAGVRIEYTPNCNNMHVKILCASVCTFLSFFTPDGHLYAQVKTATAKSDPLHSSFVSPPNAAKPRVWWHWMNGNITQDGIRKDLEWMHRTGIGGFQNFDASLMTPQIVSARLTYMTPAWQDAFRFTTRLADSLELEMAIAGSPGWSESGGPWVKPGDGMKKLVWTEVRVKGGPVNITLPVQDGVTGPFQNIPKQAGFGETVDPSKLKPFYRDVAVIAFRLPETDKSLHDLQVVVTASGGNFTVSQLTDGDVGKAFMLPPDTAKGFAWIRFAFPQPQTIKAITMVGGGNPGMFGQGTDPSDSRSLEASDDGVNYRFIAHILTGAVLQQTMAVPATTAKYFRVTVKNPPPKINALALMVGMDPGKPDPHPGTEISEIVLHTADRVQMFEEKAAFAPVGDLYKKATMPTSDVVATDDVVDLTGKMNADGRLQWTAPSGEWKLVRFGYTLLGIDNHPASPEATGPEVDKLDPDAIKRYFTNYLDQYQRATGGLMGSKGGLQFMVTDSWEAGAQNWTANLPAEFRKRRGYSLIPWMPALTGHVVKSAEASEQFLFDFRRTLSDMVAEYHYDGLTRILAERGMKRYTESHENGRALIADGMEVKRTAAVPMSALWTPNPFINQNDQTYHTMDIRESASVAHIYGQNIVAAESLTALGIPSGAWGFSPSKLKPSADLELAHGLNRYVIHTSVHQPVDDKIPGLGLGPFGQWFNRHDTWAPQAKAWADYLSRSSHLLQQGKFVADIVYYYGEDNNITSLFGKKPPLVPDGYNYDFINSDALINLLSAKDGMLVTPSGMRYRVLVLDCNASKMSLPVLRKISALVKAGAAVTGVKPVSTPSLSDDQDAFNRLVQEIWGSSRARVFTGKPLGDIMTALDTRPDFEYDKTNKDTKLLYVHRTLPDREIYWVNNRNNRKEIVTASFRVTGKVPELWHAENASKEAVSYSIENGATKVTLTLQPHDAVFVVFREKAAKTSVQLPVPVEASVASMDGDWTVHFQEQRGAPATVTLHQLESWTKSSDAVIKYFSGTATYAKTITASKDWFENNARLVLDLGDVRELAEVIVNGKSLGITWKAPFQVDLAGSLRPGENKLEIRVTNLWVNRLIGDMQPGASKITYTTMPFYQANSPLLPSGLLGPVRILTLK